MAPVKKIKISEKEDKTMVEAILEVVAEVIFTNREVTIIIPIVS